MNLYIDCEFNEFKGELISVALISDYDDKFYEVLPCDNPKSWVAQNVIPILMKDAISLTELQNKLHEFLNQFDSIHIIADWPEDIKHFCDLLIVGAGLRLNTPPLTMEVLRVDSISDVPHNALYDAIALKKVIKD